MSIAALIVAAGRGQRAGGPIPKQYAHVGGRPVLALTLDVFLAHPLVQHVVVVICPADIELYRSAIGAGHGKLRAAVAGGETRQASVRQGLEALTHLGVDSVLIHDGVRPFVEAQTISDCCAALADTAGAIVALPMPDTVKYVDNRLRVVETLDRSSLWRAQTPQGFRFTDLLAAHRAAHAAGLSDVTDDAAIAEWAKLEVRVVPGSERNRKITVAEDFTMAEHVLQGASKPEAGLPDIRSGQGFDVHAFAPGDHVWLCGLQIAHTHTLQGHSDADVALHALTDALLGAIADADIGEHFSNRDPRWRGAPSRLFLEDAVARVRARGGRICNVDITILCEAPKIAPHRAAMRSHLAGLLGIAEGRVSVKATTTEGLGFTGRREGIAALATATVILS